MLVKSSIVLFALFASIFGFSKSLIADIVIDWTSISMPISGTAPAPIPSAGVTMAGSTSGDEVIPFTLTLTRTTGTNAWYYRGTQGNTANSLLLVMGDPDTKKPDYFRASTDGITCVVTFAHAPTIPAPTGLYWGTNFTLLDIDIGASISDWQDQVTINTPGGSMTTLSGSTVNISGNKAIGTTSVAPTGSAGNLTTRYNSMPLSFSFMYTPSPQDGLLGQNQLVGLNGVGFSLAVPEPNSVGVIATVVLVVSGFCRRRKKCLA